MHSSVVLAETLTRAMSVSTVHVNVLLSVVCLGIACWWLVLAVLIDGVKHTSDGATLSQSGEH